MSAEKLNQHPKALLCLDCCTHPALIRYDKVQTEGLVSIHNVDLNNDRWTRAIWLVKLGGLGFRSAVTLAPSAFMASTAGTRILRNPILPLAYCDQPDEGSRCISACAARNVRGRSADRPICLHPENLGSIVTSKVEAELINRATTQLDKAWLFVTGAARAGDWLLTSPITAVCLRLYDETIRVAMGHRP